MKDSIDMLERVLPAEVKISFTDNAGDIMIKAGQVKMTQPLKNLARTPAMPWAVKV